ncbi:MAG TPA: tetratricopeptide repeat protein, partial [Candidatus Hydrogenedentes bacterium]|nr:tetratricopeptide repeat protein [Candidatus Hydrogenedentota bacterium]
LLGVGALMRPNILLPGGAILAWVVWHAKKGGGSTGSVITTVPVYLGSALLIIFPVIIRNWVVGGQFVFISYYGGINAYIGNNPHSGGTSPEVPDLYEISGVEEWNCFNYPSIVRGLARHLKKPDLDFSGASRYFYKRALLFWRETPLQAIALTLRKAWLFWGPHEISDSKVIHYERLHSNLLSRLPRFSLLLALALTGLVVCVLSNKSRERMDPSASALSLLFVVGYFFSILPFFISERYRFPVVPFLLPFAGFAVVLAWERLRQRKIKAVFLVTLGFILCYGVATYPLLSYAPDYSTWYLHRGLAHAAQGDMRDAEAALEQALRENPDNDEAHLQLGYIHATQGLKEDAMEHYRRALEANPNNVFAANNLGYEHYLKNEYPEAEKYYRQALERYPIYTLALNNLGNVLLREGRAEEALACFEKALDIHPHDPFARYNIGNVHLETGAFDKAVEVFQQAFEEQPFNPNIANNLGLALAHSGRLEESIAWFEKALGLSRNYPLAHFNLGNVYGDMGDLDQACCHYEQVLMVWPEHVEARERYQLLCGSLPIP